MKLSKQNLIRIAIGAGIVLVLAVLATILIWMGTRDTSAGPGSSSPSSQASRLPSVSSVSTSLPQSQSPPASFQDSSATRPASSHSASKSSASSSSQPAASAQSNPPSMPDNYTVSVSAGSNSLGIGATTKITVTVLKNGSPAPNGTPVTLDVSNPQAGTLSGATPTTTDGKATATFLAKAPGQASITATAYGVQGSANITVVSTYTFQFSSSFTTPLLYNTKDPVVSVIISQNGSPVSQGTRVHWGVEGGGISLAQSISTTNSNGLASIPVSFIIGSSGNSISAWVDGSPQKGSFSLPTQDTYSLASASSTSILLSPPSTAQQTFLVSLTKNGSPFSGGEVKWSYGGDLAERKMFTLSGNQSLSGTDGIASISGGLTVPEAGTAVVEATFSGMGAPQTVTFSFTAANLSS